MLEALGNLSLVVTGSSPENSQWMLEALGNLSLGVTDLSPEDSQWFVETGCFLTGQLSQSTSVDKITANLIPHCHGQCVWVGGWMGVGVCV